MRGLNEAFMMWCVSCKMKFSGLTGFDAHRTGKHSESEGPDRRRCRTPEEMRVLGYELKNDIWKMPMPDEVKARFIRETD